jgi:hypothetical protein
MGMPVPADKLPTHLRGAVPADKLPPHLSGTPAAAPVEKPAAGGAGPAASYPLSAVGIDQPADIPGVGLLVNTGEALWNAGSKAVSGYAGLLGSVLPGPEGQGADWQRRTNETLRTDFTPNKDPLVNLPAQAVNAGAGLIDRTAPGQAFNNFVETTPGMKEGLEGGMDIATLLGTAAPLGAARAGVNASREAIASSERLLGNRRGAPPPGGVVPGPGDKPYLGTPIAEASRAGINVTPWEVQQGVAGNPASVTGSTRAGFGTGAVNKETAMGNAPRINEIGVRGMPDGITPDPRTGRIEPNVIEGAKNVERAKYDAVRQVPGDGTSLELQRELGGVARGLENVPEAVANDVTRIIRTHAVGGPSTKLVDDIMALRQDATMNSKRAYNMNDPTARQLAGYQRQISDVLEAELARRGETAGLVGVRETLQEARVNFAKIATLEEALDDGFIDAARLEKVTEGGGYLSDGLADVSRFNQSASVSMTHPKRITQAIEPNFRAGATPTDVAARSAQFIGGNWLTKKIGRGGVNAINEELRGFRVPEQPAAPRAPAFDFERAPEPMGPPFPEGASSPVAPPAPSSVPPGVQPYDRLSDRLAPDFNPEVLDPRTGQPHEAAISSFLADTNPDVIPWERPGAVASPVNTAGRPPYVPGEGVPSPAGQGSISSDLGPVSEFPALNEGIEGRGILNRPRGVTGPKSASLKDPSLPPDLQVGDQPPPRTPDFGPADEFAEPAGGFADELAPTSEVVSNTPTEHIVRHNGRVEGPFTTRETADGALAYLQENSPAAPASIADELSLAPDNGPPRSRVDVTENLPSQGTTAFPNRYKRPEATRIETADGYISYVDEGDRWKLDDAFVRENARGQGKGQGQLVDAARKAQEARKQLDSDVKVSDDQRRVYAKLKEKGQLEFDGPFEEGSVFRNIRPAGGSVADDLVATPPSRTPALDKVDSFAADLAPEAAAGPDAIPGLQKYVEQTIDPVIEGAAAKLTGPQVNVLKKLRSDMAGYLRSEDAAAVEQLLQKFMDTYGRYLPKE